MDYHYDLGPYSRKVTTTWRTPSVGSTVASIGASVTTMRRLSPASRRRWRPTRTVLWPIGASATRYSATLGEVRADGIAAETPFLAPAIQHDARAWRARLHTAAYCGQDFERRQPSRHPGRAADEIRAGYQSPDRHRNWADNPTCRTRPRRRSDRVICLQTDPEELPHPRRRTVRAVTAPPFFFIRPRSARSGRTASRPRRRFWHQPFSTTHALGERGYLRCQELEIVVFGD